MSDIVAALREGIEPYEGISAAEQIMEMAADEIEGLRRTLLIEREVAIADITELRAEIERLRGGIDAWLEFTNEQAREIQRLRAGLRE